MISVHRLDPFGEKIMQGVIARMVKAPACIFAPDDKSVSVRFVQIATLKNPLMKSCAVETHGLRQFYILYKCVVRRSGIDAFGIISLVKHEPHEDGLSVYQQTGFVKFNLSHSEIRTDFILAALAGNGDVKVVEGGGFYAPESELVYRHGDADIIAGCDGFRLADFLSGERCFKSYLFFSVACDFCADEKHTVVNIGVELYINEVCGGDSFEPYRLPDAR